MLELPLPGFLIFLANLAPQLKSPFFACRKSPTQTGIAADK
jgi:hypothetical protein